MSRAVGLSQAKLILVIDLGESFFQHSVLFVQDLFNGGYLSPFDDPSVDYAARVSVHIGDDPDWQRNPQCEGSPFLDPEDPSKFGKSYTTADGTTGIGYNFGFEAWCNMQGRYTSFVWDMNFI